MSDHIKDGLRSMTPLEWMRYWGVETVGDSAPAAEGIMRTRIAALYRKPLQGKPLHGKPKIILFSNPDCSPRLHASHSSAAGADGEPAAHFVIHEIESSPPDSAAG